MAFYANDLAILAKYRNADFAKHILQTAADKIAFWYKEIENQFKQNASHKLHEKKLTQSKPYR